MSTPSLQLPVGATYQLRPTFIDQNSRPLSPQPAPATVSYSSDTPAVAIVDASGKVTAVAAGSCSITASSGSLSTPKVVTVYVPVASKIVV